MMSMKKKIEFKLDQELFDKYKSHCEENGYDMSKRLRKFIESEIPKKYELIEVSEIKFKPEFEIETIDVMGQKYIAPRKGPNVFVVKTDIDSNINYVSSIDDIPNEDSNDVKSFKERNLMFYKAGKIYKLEGCSINTSFSEEYTILECKSWSISVNVEFSSSSM